MIINSTENDAVARVGRIRRSRIGECKINCGTQSINVTVEASIGVVEWNGSERGPELLARADHSMYGGKPSMKSLRAV